VTDDRALEELLAAYALHSCDPDEAVAVEALLRRRPDLAEEVDRLATAAAWLGALEASEPPPALRDAVLASTRPSDHHPNQAALLYKAEAARLERELDRLDPEQYGEVTTNGLTALGLVVHLAAQETLFARSVGRPVDDVNVAAVEARTTVFAERYRDRPYADVVELWHRAVDAVLTWSEDDPGSRSVDWMGQPMRSYDALIARSFENWVHRDDLRRVRGQTSEPPPGPELRLMAAMSVRTLPAALAVTGHARPGRSARVVLTGEGGGSWIVALDDGVVTGNEPDVTLTASALDWCLLVGERLDSSRLHYAVEGDEGLARDLVGAAPAFATL